MRRSELVADVHCPSAPSASRSFLAATRFRLEYGAVGLPVPASEHCVQRVAVRFPSAHVLIRSRRGTDHETRSPYVPPISRSGAGTARGEGEGALHGTVRGVLSTP